MDNVRIVVIGFGGMGSQYAEMIGTGRIEGLSLAGVCCRNEPGQKRIRELYPQAAVYSSVEDTFAHGADFDGVIIVTPHETHAAIGREAFAHGKHVLCDKPVGITTRQAREFLAAKREDTAFAMMFNKRTNPSFGRARELIRGGELGRVTRVIWVCNDWFRTPAYHHSAPWRSSWEREYGGLMINQCQHYLDLWQWLFGMPDTIDADLDFGKYNDFMVDDGVDIRFCYDRAAGDGKSPAKGGDAALGQPHFPGLRGNLISSTGENPGVNRMEIWGSMGKLTITDGKQLAFDRNVTDIADFNRENKEVYGKLAHEEQILISEPETGAYEKVLQNFSDHLRKGTPLMATGEDGLRSLILANGTYLSAWTKSRLRLPLDDGLYERLLAEKIEEEKAARGHIGA